MPIAYGRIVPFAVVALLLAAIGLTWVSGIYPDEVAYKIFLERYFLTGGFKESVTPYCGDGFLVAPPLLLVPAAAAWAQLSLLGSSWLSYRILPYLCLLVTFLVLVHHNRQRGNGTFWPLLLSVTFGTTLFGITMFRPEIVMLAACMIFFLLGTRMLAARQALPLYLHAVAALLLYSLVVYMHPKAIYLFVVPAAAIILSASNIAGRANRILFACISIGAFLAVTLAAIALHQKEFLSCGAVPQIQGKMGVQSVNPMDVIHPARFIAALKLAFGQAEWIHTTNMLYRPWYQTGFLPPEALSVFDRIADLGILAALAGFVGYIAFKIVRCATQWRSGPESRTFLLVLSVIAALTAPFILSIEKHFYETSFYSFSLMVFAALLWPLMPQIHGLLQNRLLALARAGLIALSVLCVALSYHDFVIPLLNGYRGPDVPDALDRSAVRRTVDALLGGTPVAANAPMFESDVTYEALKDRPYVMPITYTSFAFSAPGTTRAYVEKLGFHYGVIECSLLNGLTGAEFPAHVLKSAHITQQLHRVRADFDLCLFEIAY